MNIFSKQINRNLPLMHILVSAKPNIKYTIDNIMYIGWEGTKSPKPVGKDSNKHERKQ